MQPSLRHSTEKQSWQVGERGLERGLRQRELMYSSKRCRQGSLDVGDTSLLKPEHSKLPCELPVGGGQFAPHSFPQEES